MNLEVGSYTLYWSAAPAGEGSCQHRAALETTDELVIRPLMNLKISTAVTDKKIALTAPRAGQYYIDVNSDCRWSFRLVPAT